MCNLPKPYRWFLPVIVSLAVGVGTWIPRAEATGKVRPSVLAGHWYPESKTGTALFSYLLLRSAEAAPKLAEKPLALVLPHAGWQYSGLAAAAGIQAIHPGDYSRLIVLAPSHREGFPGFALDEAQAYRTPLGLVPLCPGVTEKLAGGEVAKVRPKVGEQEHAIEVLLPLLQARLGKFCLVPVLAGQTTFEVERAFAARLATLQDGKTLFVVSSDFTHYGPRYDYTPWGPLASGQGPTLKKQDLQAAQFLAKKDASGFHRFLEKTGATICGRSGLATLAEWLRQTAPGSKMSVLAHYSSGDLPEPDADNAVDYLALAFSAGSEPVTPPLTRWPALASVSSAASEIDPAEGATLVRLARATLETELLGKDDLLEQLARLPTGSKFDRLQAVFVTLQRRDPKEIASLGRLRGCIGQVEPTHPLFAAVVKAALDAALRDPRFEPVEGLELGRLEIEVTVLSPQTPIGSWKEIQLGRHGIVLEKDGHRALFLPQVPGEQGWTLEQTLEALARKAGLSSGAWREGARFSVFSGQVFKETPVDSKHPTQRKEK